MPLIPGRRTSNMRQSALRGWVEFKNSSAEANRFTSKPADLISLCSDLRTEISSSTTEIRDMLPLSKLRTEIWSSTTERTDILEPSILLMHAGGEEIYYTLV